MDLDNNISKKALNAVKQCSMGHMITCSQKQHIHRALAGACVNALLLHGKMYLLPTQGFAGVSLVGGRTINGFLCLYQSIILGETKMK